MRFMFLIPLFGGALPSLIIKSDIPRISFNLWNAGIATLVFGCLVRGIINISGRFTEYDMIYWVIGGILIISAIIYIIKNKLY